MEIQISDNTTLISTDKTMLSISIARQSEDVVKCFVFSDLKINVNALGDHLDRQIKPQAGEKATLTHKIGYRAYTCVIISAFSFLIRLLKF